MNLIWFCLISYGLTQIIVYGKIFKPFRPTNGKLGELFKCPMCAGFWVGIFLWSVNGYTQLINFDDSLVTGFLLGAVASASAYVGTMVFGDDGIKTFRLIETERSGNGPHD